MRSTNLYSTIGPFTNVPEGARVRAAAAANEAASKAFAASARDARENGDVAYGHKAVTPGVIAVNRIDKRNASTARTERAEAWFCIVAGVLFALVLCLPGISLLPSYLTGVPLPDDLTHTAIGLAVAGILFFGGVCTFFSVRRLRELGRSGCTEDYLAVLARNAAGVCWLLGDKAMYITETTAAGTSTSTVFYDAIGTVRSSFDKDGIELLEISGREGLSLASIRCPEGDQASSADQLADLLRGLAEKAWKR